MMSDYEVAIGENGNASDFYVKFHAPKDSTSIHSCLLNLLADICVTLHEHVRT